MLYKRLPFNPLTDLAPITLIASSPTILVVPPALPVNTLAEFVAYLKARPGELNYASYGVGSSPHLATELFQSMTGTKVVHVPYSGGGPAAVGVMGNNVQMLFSSVLPVLGLVRGGQLKPIAIASDRRSPLLPDVPTFAESGVDYQLQHLVRAAGARQDAGRASSRRCTGTRSTRCRSRGARAHRRSRAPRWSPTRRPNSAPSSRPRWTGLRR